MYNSTKPQPTSNAFGLIFLDYSNIAKLDKLLRKKIVSPLLQCLNYSIKFLIINLILSFGIIQIFTKISNRSTFLAQNNSYCNTTSITVNLKHLLKFGSAKIGCFVTFSFDKLKFLSAPLVHSNSFLSPLIIFVKGLQILLKPLINFL